jgi:pyruvate dehydrogenase E1 component beta subunit
MRKVRFRDAIREAMSEEMRRDQTVFLMGEEVAEYDGAYKVSQGMLAEFGSKRVIDTPISELGFAGIAVGAAMNGLRPIVEFMTWNFAILAFDQIINGSAKMLSMSAGEFGNPIVFRGPQGAAGQLGAQHSQMLTNMLASVPGLKVISPSNGYDAKGLLKSAIRDNDPVMFMESEQMYSDQCELPDEEYLIPIGKCDIKRAGEHVTIVSYNKMMKIALQAAEELSKDGIEAEVIDLMTIRPLDIHTIIESVKKTNRCVVVDESWPFTSIASEVAFQLQRYAFDYLDAPVRRVCGADSSMHYAQNLVEAYMPSVSKVVNAVKEIAYVK